MSKRFTDTGKWDKGSFSDLSIKMKLVWLYLCDKCDHAGVWDLNIKLLSFQIGENISIDELLSELGDKVELRDNKLLLKTFIEFQYGTLNSENRVHKSVLDRLAKINSIKPLTSPLQGAKDKDKDKDKEKEKDKDKDKEKESKQFLDFESAYNLYPLKKGKSVGMKKLLKTIKTEVDLELFKKALLNYKKDLELNNTGQQYIKHFSTFTNEWADWLDYVPSVNNFNKSKEQQVFERAKEQLARIERGEL